MLIKTISHKHRNFRVLVEYLLKEHEHSEIFVSRYLRNNEREIDDLIKAFERGNNRRERVRSNSVIMRHSILSFEHCKELPDTEKLKDLTKTFSRLFAPKTLMISSIHEEKNHKHIHVLHLATNTLGKSNRLSKKEFEAVKERVQERQIELGITHSVVNHAKKKFIQENIKIQSIE